MNERIGYFSPEANEKEGIPFRCSVWMGKHSVNVYSEVSNFLPYFEGLGVNYIPSFPGWCINRQPSKSEYSIIYQPREEASFEFDQVKKTLKAFGDIEDYKDGQVLAYIGFWLMEAQRQAESMYTMHSSALSIDGKGILLFGHSGSGKTSLLLALGKKYGGEVVSNDLTVVSYDPDVQNMFLVDGTKEIRLRLASIKAKFPNLTKLFPNEGNLSPWDDKVAVYPEDVGMETNREPKPVKSAFLVHLDSNGTEDLVVYQENGISVRYTLYEDMSRIIRGSAISLFGRQSNILGYIPSLDNPQLHQGRVEAIEFILKKIGLWNISGGDIDQVCETIAKITLF